MNRFILLILSGFLFIATPAFGKSSAQDLWIVSERSGDVRVLRSGMQPVSLRNDGHLEPGDVISTGATGRAVLTRVADYVIVAPNSRVQLPPASAPDGITHFFQQAGTLLYKIRHMGVPHFEVETPMLAAVVKGTTFTVIVDKDRSAVQVTNGKVEVTAATGGMQRLVTTGETVFINRESPLDLILASADIVGGSGGPTQGDIKIDGTSPEPLSAVGTLTAGLVQEAVARPIQVVELPPPSLLASATQSPASTVEPVATTPAVAVPGVTTPVVVVPAVTTPVVTLPPVTLPAVTTPVVTLPPVTLPPVTLPPVTLPPVTVPVVTLPPVTVPVVTLPPVTTPPVTVPPVTIPPVTLPPILGF